MNGSRIRRPAGGRSRAGRRPCGASRYPAAAPPTTAAITTTIIAEMLTSDPPPHHERTRKPYAATIHRRVDEHMRPRHTRGGLPCGQRGGCAIEPKGLRVVDYKPADQSSRHTHDNSTPVCARRRASSQNLYTAAPATSRPPRLPSSRTVARTKQSSPPGGTRALLIANLGTLGVVGAPSRMPTSPELRSAMNSGATPAPTPRSRRCLRIA